jgi:hypothetical protein
MKIESIEDLLAIKESSRLAMVDTLNSLGDDDSVKRSDDGGWSIAEIAEHVSIVEAGVGKILDRLISAAVAAGIPRSDAPVISPQVATIFGNAGGVKVEAPEMVHPRGQRSIAESIESLNETSVAIADIFSRVGDIDLTEPRFPHPFFGQLNSTEWLAVLAFHEMRHLDQIRRILGEAEQ